jgi:predicted permease
MIGAVPEIGLPPDVRRRAASRIYREIVFHGYSGTGITGMPVKNAEKVIASAAVYKYVLTVFVAVAMSLLVTYAAIGGAYNRSIFPISVFVWTMLISLVTAMQLSYGASGSGNIRNFLSTMPLGKKDASWLAASAMMKTIDMPLASSLLIIALSFFELGFYGMLAGFLALMTGFSVFLITASLTTKIFKGLHVDNRISLIVRLLSSLPLIFFIAVPTILFRLDINFGRAELMYTPILSLAGVMNGYLSSVIVSFIFGIALTSYGFHLFGKSAIQLISPNELVGRTAGRLKLKIRSPLASLIITDLRQVLRSPRLAGLFFIPFVLMVVVVFYFTSSADGRFMIPFPVFYTEDILPMALVSSYIAYILYMTELRGLAYFKMLSVSKYLNLAAKLVVSLLLYAVSAAVLTTILIISGRVENYVTAIYTLFFPLLASVIFTSVYFQNAVRETKFGISNPSSYMFYAIANLAVFAIPAGVFLASVLLFRNQLFAGLSIALVSSVEVIVMMIFLFLAPD